MTFKDLDIGDKFISVAQCIYFNNEPILYIKIKYTKGELMNNDYNALALYNKSLPNGYFPLELVVYKCV